MKYLSVLLLIFLLATCGNAKRINLPVYFHVITDETVGHVPEIDLKNSLKILNKAFTKHGRSPQTPFGFYLAGIYYTNNKTWFHIQGKPVCYQFGQMKTLLHQGGIRAINIYIVDLPDNYLGCAILPKDILLNPNQDGIVVDYQYLSTVVIPHEVGHLFGLQHVAPSSSCTNYMEPEVTSCAVLFSKGQVHLMIKTFRKYRY